jgi:hypothetical protein
MVKQFHFLLVTALLTGCISFLPQKPPIKEAVFRGSMQQIWIAAEKALANHPIAESNIDAGFLKTDDLRGPNCWVGPDTKDKLSSGIRCHLLLQFVKMPGSGIRVRVTKVMDMIRDFVSEPESFNSDGLEEMTLLYRIDRELTIAKELERQAASSE